MNDEATFLILWKTILNRQSGKNAGKTVSLYKNSKYGITEIATQKMTMRPAGSLSRQKYQEGGMDKKMTRKEAARRVEQIVNEIYDKLGEIETILKKVAPEEFGAEEAYWISH